jgi:hypothetical protein
MEDLLQRESQVANQTQSDNPTAIELCDTAIALFNKGFAALNNRVKVEPVRTETTQLLAMGFNALRWSREQLVKGYYSPAVTMARTGFECWLHGAYLNLYPERLEDWNQYRTRPKPDKMRPLVAQRSSPDDNAQVNSLLTSMNAFYLGTEGARFSGLSVLSHPSPEAFRILVKTEQDGEHRLRVGPDYDQALFNLALDAYGTAAALCANLSCYSLKVTSNLPSCRTSTPSDNGSTPGVTSN